MTDAFDATRDHRFAPTRWLEDFRVGETFWIPSRTQTDALFAAFQLASGVVAMRATVHNQRNELVLEGLHRYLIRKRPVA